MRAPLGARITTAPCALTDPSAVPPHGVRATPAAIVSGPGRPFGGQLRAEGAIIVPSNVRDTPTSVPSNAVVGAGASAAAGIAGPYGVGWGKGRRGGRCGGEGGARPLWGGRPLGG